VPKLSAAIDAHFTATGCDRTLTCLTDGCRAARSAVSDARARRGVSIRVSTYGKRSRCGAPFFGEAVALDPRERAAVAGKICRTARTMRQAAAEQAKSGRDRSKSMEDQYFC
jgi:hypothetical protein